MTMRIATIISLVMLTAVPAMAETKLDISDSPKWNFGTVIHFNPGSTETMTLSYPGDKIGGSCSGGLDCKSADTDQVCFKTLPLDKDGNLGVYSFKETDQADIISGPRGGQIRVMFNASDEISESGKKCIDFLTGTAELMAPFDDFGRYSGTVKVEGRRISDNEQVYFYMDVEIFVHRALSLSAKKLDFGKVAMVGGSRGPFTVTLNPVNNTRQCSDGMECLSGGHDRGTIEIIGTPDVTVAVSMPELVTLSGSNGGEAELKLTSSLQGDITVLDRDGKNKFYNGGTVTFDQNDPSGSYTGTASLNINYN